MGSGRVEWGGVSRDGAGRAGGSPTKGGDDMLLVRVIMAVLVGIFAALQAFADEGGDS
jgi:hypothetical protein